MSFHPPVPQWVNYSRDTMKTSFYTLPTVMKVSMSVKLLPLTWGFPFYKERGGPHSLTYSFFSLSYHLLPSRHVLPNVWDFPPVPLSRRVNGGGGFSNLSFPFFYISDSVLDFLTVSLCHSQWLLCSPSLSNCPRDSEPYHSLPSLPLLFGGRWKTLKLWGESRSYINKEKTIKLEKEKKHIVLEANICMWS